MLCLKTCFGTNFVNDVWCTVPTPVPSFRTTFRTLKYGLRNLLPVLESCKMYAVKSDMSSSLIHPDFGTVIYCFLLLLIVCN